jgi:hypothetical protein
MQTRGKQARLHFPECNLSYAKIRPFADKTLHILQKEAPQSAFFRQSVAD